MNKDKLKYNHSVHYRYPKVRFGIRKPHTQKFFVEDLTREAKIIYSYPMCGLIIITNDFSRCIKITELSVDEIKAVLGNSKSVDELFEHLEYLTTMELPVIEFTHLFEDEER